LTQLPLQVTLFLKELTENLKTTQPSDSMVYYYIEADGQVFLIEKDGLLRFPQSKEEVPFEFEIVRKMPLEDEVQYCHPKIDNHPDWVYKEDVPGLENVDRVVRIAVNRSLVRHVSDAIIVKGEEVLLVKNLRGLSASKWDLPGGFITYGESPERSLVREVKEETGVEIKIDSLLHINTNISQSSGLYFIAFIYVCSVTGGELKPDPTEIEKVEWVPLDKAIELTEGFVKDSLEIYKKSK